MNRSFKNLLYVAFILVTSGHQYITAESEFRVLPDGQTAQTQSLKKPFRRPGQVRFDKKGTRQEWGENKRWTKGSSDQKGRWGHRGDIQRGGHGRKRMNDSKPQNISEQQQRLVNGITRTQTNQLDALVKFERVFGKNSLNQETYNLLNKNQEAIAKTIEELKPVQNDEMAQ